jgi:ureidoglycolate hydrolase
MKTPLGERNAAMATIHELKIEPMTEESFAPFGELWDTADRPGDHRVSSPTGYKYDGRTTVHVIWQLYDGSTFNELERHWGVTQSFIQLSGSPAVVCVAHPPRPRIRRTCPTRTMSAPS